MNLYEIITYSSFTIIIIFILIIVYTQFPKEQQETERLNKKYYKLINQKTITNEEFKNYMSILNSKAIWRLALIFAFLLTVMLGTCIKVLRHTDCNLILFLFVTLFVCFCSFYLILIYNNFHLICGGRGCAAF